jgi:small subunit ribosomal protein S8e
MAAADCIWLFSASLSSQDLQCLLSSPPTQSFRSIVFSSVRAYIFASYRNRNHGYQPRQSTQALCLWCQEVILPCVVESPYVSGICSDLKTENFTGKKRAFEAGRQESNTRIGAKRIHLVRTRGGNRKFRALRLESGNFSWASEGIARKVRVIVVAFHPSNNELVRTNTLTKSAVVQIDAAPFRQWYEAHYGQNLGRRRQQKAGQEHAEPEKKSKGVEKKQATRFAAQGKVEPALEKQFEAGRLFAVIASRPGQSGRVDGYVLEGEELAFYQRQLRR